MRYNGICIFSIYVNSKPEILSSRKYVKISSEDENWKNKGTTLPFVHISDFDIRSQHFSSEEKYFCA